MVMGANIGTTVTNTVVSMAHMSRAGEFRRAFAAATVHDFFNVCAVAILLPLEVAFGLISNSAEWLSDLLFTVFGRPAYLFTVMVFYLGWMLYREQKTQQAKSEELPTPPPHEAHG